MSRCFLEDSSLNCGSEIISPILHGDIGYNERKKVCDIVKNCETDRSSGYHLHIDYRDICDNFDKVKNTWILYNRVEKILYDILPQSRHTSTYCYKQEINYSSILNIEDMDSLKKLFYSDDNRKGTRYFGINISSIFDNRTLEIRSHNGTTSFVKITQWIKIHLCLVNYATTKDTFNILELTKKLDNLNDTITLLRNIGCNDDTIEYYRSRYSKHNKFSMSNTLG